MQLLYVWIEEYGCLKNIGFNLGGPYKFEYNQQNNMLKCEENASHIEGFFNNADNTNSNSTKAYINNVSAIIGSNGAGKTTFLNFIKEYFPNGTTLRDKHKILFIVKDKCLKAYVKGFDIKKENIISEDSIEPIPYCNTLKGKNIKGDILPEYSILPKPNNISYIYFSNIIDMSYENEVDKLENISSNYLIRQDKKDLIDNKIKSEKIDSTLAYSTEESIRECDFIADYKNKFKEMLGFNPPESISFIVKNFLEGDLKENLITRLKKKPFKQFSEDGEISDTPLKLIKKFKDFIINQCIEFKTDTNNSDYIKLNLFLSHVFENINFTNGSCFLKDFNLLPKGNIIAKLEYILKNGGIFSGDEGKAKKLIAVYAYIDKISIINTPVEKASEFIKTYRTAFSLFSPFNVKFKTLSSGEKAMLQIFSRFFSIHIEKAKISNCNIEENVLILMDEPDLYLHPEWQRLFLSKLLPFLQDIYAHNNGTRNIQIIMASNSPMLISDLPSTNVVFLRKNTEGNVIADDIEIEQTFGANIHTLFRDSFFLESTIGEFAKQKINTVIDSLKSKQDKEQIKKIINIIGEPFLKQKLQDEYEKLYSIDEKIERMEKELAELKSQKGKNNDI